MSYYQRKIQNLEQEPIQNEAQIFQTDSWASEILRLDDSHWFSLKPNYQIQGYKNLDQSLLQALPFHNEVLNLEIDDSNGISSSLSEQKKSVESILKQSHQTQQNFQSYEMQEAQQQTCYQANYHRGHIDYLCQLTTPIFIQSRKCCKSRRKMHKRKTYYGIVSKHMKGQESTSCKRYDQYHLQEAFKRMGVKEQEEKQATLQGIRHLKKYRRNPENKKLLEKHRQKYMQCRKWAIFIEQLVNSSE